MKFTSIDEKIKELISEGITDELSDHLADVHKLVEDKLAEVDIPARICEYLKTRLASSKLIATEIDEYANTNKFKGYLADIVAAEVAEHFKKLPSDYVITLLCAALTRLVK